MYIEGIVRKEARDLLGDKKGLEFKIKNRCILSGRAHGVMRDFKVSRMEFKKLAVQGMLLGVKKSSW